MKQFLLSLAIGLVAAVIDITPMIIKKLDPMFIAGAFCMWIVTAIITPWVRWTDYSWLNGMIVAVLIFIPILFLIIRLDKTAIPQVFLTTLILGSAVGFFAQRI